MEVNSGASVDVGHIFFMVRFRPWDPTNPRFGRRRSILWYAKQDSETTTLLAAVRCCITTTLAAYSRRLTLVKRIPKLRFESVSLFSSKFNRSNLWWQSKAFFYVMRRWRNGRWVAKNLQNHEAKEAARFLWFRLPRIRYWLTTVEKDAFAVRHFLLEGMELMSSRSFFKSLGLYGKFISKACNWKLDCGSLRQW